MDMASPTMHRIVLTPTPNADGTLSLRAVATPRFAWLRRLLGR